MEAARVSFSRQSYAELTTYSGSDGLSWSGCGLHIGLCSRLGNEWLVVGLIPAGGFHGNSAIEVVDSLSNVLVAREGLR